ncbi:UNVERIFIED_CONTAM: sterol carrier protein 2 [Brevibacillus sp. OAP136]
MARANIIGVGMVPFKKPGHQEPYEVMAAKAVQQALTDAQIDYRDIEQAYASYVYGDSTCGQTALYRIGLSGIPIINVNNNCSSGATALFLARQAVESGAAECVLAFGFEEMKPGALGSVWNDRTSPFQSFLSQLDELAPDTPEAPLAPRLFGAAGKSYLETYGANPDIFAHVAVKTRAHAAHNPFAIFRDPLTVEEVLASPLLFPHLNRLCACPPSCGAAAAVVCSDAFVRKHGGSGAVQIVAQAMTTDTGAMSENAMNLVGYDMARRAAHKAYEQAGFGPDSVQVVELHDCFTPNEVISYEALGLCSEGGAEAFIREGNNTYGGKYVVNPSGGLMSKGHPLGATGLAQCAELVWQLRGQAGERQVPDANIALQHNLGLGGACVVTIYQKS